MQSKIQMTATEFKSTQGYRDIQSTVQLYWLSKDKTIESFAQQSMQQRDEIRELREKKDVIQQIHVQQIADVINSTNEKVKKIEATLTNIPTWHNVSSVAKMKGLSSDAVRKQLSNGEFIDGEDFKKEKHKILIHQGAVERIHRRRSSNG